MASTNLNNDFVQSSSDKLAYGGSSTSSSNMPSNLNSFNSQNGSTNNSTTLFSNNDFNQGLPSNANKSYSEFDSKDENIPEEFVNKSLDGKINSLQKLYDDLNRKYIKGSAFRLNPVENFFSGGLGDQYESSLNSIKNERDAVFRLLTEARNQRIHYYSNLNTELNKYNIEAEALKRQGITNKYYLLKNGPLGNAGANLSTGSGFGISPNIEKKQKPNKDIWKLLFSLITLGLLKK